MATSSALLSLDEYLRTSYKPDVDFVDGVLEERNLGEFSHARIQALLSAFFIGREKAWSIQTVVEQRIRVIPTNVRICDIALLRADAPREAVTLTPPLLCLEIMSPEDRLPRIKLVLADYFAMGVPNIWLVDPIRRAAYTFGAEGLAMADPTNLAVPGSTIMLDLTDAFAAID